MARRESRVTLRDAGLGRASSASVAMAIDAQRRRAWMTRPRTPRCSSWQSAQRVAQSPRASGRDRRPPRNGCRLGVAGEAGVVGHARERAAVAGRAILREEAVRVRQLAGVPGQAHEVGSPSASPARARPRPRMAEADRPRSAATRPTTAKSTKNHHDSAALARARPGRARCGSATSAAPARRPAAAPARP